MDSKKIVIIGGGHAAVQLCISLVDVGRGNDIVLISEELVLPYHRPPLSKAFLKSDTETIQIIRGMEWFAEHGIQLFLGEKVVRIDAEEHQILLENGLRMGYQYLVIATGASARSLSSIPENTSNVFSLRTKIDAEIIRSKLNDNQDILVLGGGFVGLEFAATAATMGHHVVLLESGSRLLARSVSPQLSDHVLKVQTELGVDVYLSAQANNPVIEGNRFVGMNINGEFKKFSWMLVAIGGQPNEDLAKSCGISCDNGILVDDYMRTSDPSILAIGDCTRFPLQGKKWLSHNLRLESIQNANDQAKVAASTICGGVTPYHSLPWFWSEQGSSRIQISGLLPMPIFKTQRVSGSASGSFSLYHFDEDGQLACVESINFPSDHMKAKKELALRW
jgi:3-phenylpropionate/trans-cinnamate dioxygenase ferredoxin reductase subunit